MTAQIARRDGSIKMPSVVTSSDISNLLTKLEEDLWRQDTEKAKVKLEVVGQIYDGLTHGCGFYGRWRVNYQRYLGLKQIYEEQAGASSK